MHVEGVEEKEARALLVLDVATVVDILIGVLMFVPRCLLTDGQYTEWHGGNRLKAVEDSQNSVVPRSQLMVWKR